MKILIATCHRNVVGGVETYLQTVIPALMERGHRIGLLCDYVGDTTKPMIDPAVEDLPFWSGDRLEQEPALWSGLMDWRPDIVYSHGLSSPDIDRRLQENFSTVRYIHGYWGTCTTGRKYHAMPGIQHCQRVFGPMCLLLHYPRRCGGLNPVLALKMFQTERTNNSLLHGYRAVLVASRHMHTEILRHGVAPEHLHLVRYPVPHSARCETALSKIPGGRLLFVGRLTDVKGLDFLIGAIPEAEITLGRKLTLTVAGDGPELSRLQALAERERVTVEFRGWVNHSEKMDLMQQSDLLVVPSLWPEPFGLVGVEAGSIGLPAAGFAAGGIPDWLIPAQTGELAPGDPPTREGLADAIARALGDHKHYSQLCRGALEFSRGFTVSAHTAELETLLYANVAPSGSQSAAQLLALQNDHE